MVATSSTIHESLAKSVLDKRTMDDINNNIKMYELHVLNNKSSA